MAREEDEYHGLLQSTIGIMFMGTPHDGADGAKLVSTAADIANSLTTFNTIQLKTLERDSEQLQDISRSFGFLEDLKIVTVIESNKTRIPGLGKHTLVGRYSVYLTGGSTLTGQDCTSGFCSSQPWES